MSEIPKEEATKLWWGWIGGGAAGQAPGTLSPGQELGPTTMAITITEAAVPLGSKTARRIQEWLEAHRCREKLPV